MSIPLLEVEFTLIRIPLEIYKQEKRSETRQKAELDLLES